MHIPDWMITEEMKHTEHYRMYAEVFGLDVPLTQSQPTESTQRTHRTPSSPRSPTPKKDTAESSAPKRLTVIRFRLPERRSKRLTPPAPVPTVDKADEMILQDTLQVSLVEYKSREEQEARENVELVNKHLRQSEILKRYGGSEESYIITNDEEVEITNVVIPVNVNEEEDEITDKVYEVKRREKGKIVEESRSTPFPTPIRSPKTHTNLVSSDTEKLQELTVTDTQTTSSSRSQNTKLSKANRLLSLFKAKPAWFKRYKNFFQELQGRYTYLFEHLKKRFLSRKSFDTLADHHSRSNGESLTHYVKRILRSRLKSKFLSRFKIKFQSKISSQIQKAIDNQIPSQVDASVNENEQGPSTSGNQKQEDDYDFWIESYASDDDEIPTNQMTQDIMEEVYLTIDEVKLNKTVDEMLRQRCTWVNKYVKKFNPYARYGVEHWKNPHAKIFYIKKHKESGKPKKRFIQIQRSFNPFRDVQELGHEHKFIAEIVARSLGFLVHSKIANCWDLQGDALLHYDADMELMNLILLLIPNGIYNSVDACTSAKDMWKRVERLIRGTIENKVDRETHFTKEFDQFVVEPREALVFVYNRFAQLMNNLERNDMHFPIVTINTKFLNNLQPEWLKYVTQVRLAKRPTVDTFDDLFDYLQQFEKLANVSRAKKLEKYHDPLALVAHTGSSSRNTSSYYVTHPTSVVDYDDEYQQDDVHTNFEDPLSYAMLLLARAITQKFSNPTNNRLRTLSNTRNQAIIQGDRRSNALNETGNVQRTLRTSSLGNISTVQCYNCCGKGHYARNCPKPRVRDSKYFMEQMLLAKQDEARVILTDEQNDFLFADATRMEEIEELGANICLMAIIQPVDNTSDDGPSYDSALISEVESSSNNENEEQMYPTHTKIINSTIGDDQIDSDITFDSPNGNVNSGSVEKDTHVPDLCALEQLARNAYQEAEKQQIFAQKVQKQNTTLTSQLELYKESVRVLENINGENNYLNEFLEADKPRFSRSGSYPRLFSSLQDRDRKVGSGS
ncbi:retrovirus-related pol polyprotein from transposon TNT 1-94 [Tanacetum coccineum]